MAEKQTIFSSPLWNKIFAILVAVLASYTGYDKYQESKASTETTVNLNVSGVDSSKPAEVHSHGAVLTREQIAAIVAAAIKAQHEADLEIFKQKEAWE